MALYSILAAIHVIMAIGGLGQLSVFGFMTRNPTMVNLPLLRRIFRAVGESLIVMLITGLAMMWITHWVYEPMWWFRIGFILFLALGAMHGIGQSKLKRMMKAETEKGQPVDLGQMRILALIMAITLGAITFLMEAKPF